MENTALLAEIEPVAEALLERHLANAREWFPHEYVPWSVGRDFDPARPWSPDEAPMSDGLRSALLVNLLTEDNLPHYFRTLDRKFGSSGAWGEWGHRWTAEEGRHSIVIRDYLVVTRSVDPVELERGRMAQVITGWEPPLETLADTLAYTSLQELATRVSHSNTGRLLGDEHGRRLMARVAGDEGLHHLFYRDAMAALLELDPNGSVMGIDRVVRSFAMPGTGIANFKAHSKAIAAAGIYDFASHHASVLVPVVLTAWKLDEIDGLDREAEQARDRCLAHIEKVGRVGERMAQHRAELVTAS